MQGLWRAERVRSTEKCGLWTLELVVVGVELGAPTAPIEPIRGSKQTRARFNSTPQKFVQLQSYLLDTALYIAGVQ